MEIVRGTAPTPEIALITGPNGDFSLGLPPGEFEIRAAASSGSSGKVMVEGGESSTSITIRLGADES